MRKFLKRPALFFLAVFILGSLYGCGKQSASSEDQTDVVFEKIENESEVTESKEEPETEEAAIEISSMVKSKSGEETSVEAREEADLGASGTSDSETGNHEDEDSIMQLVKSMSTMDKLTMMMMPTLRKWGASEVTSLSNEQYKFLQDNHFGGLILFSENIETNEQTFRLIRTMQKANYEGGAPAQLFIACDQEGGFITRLDTGTELVGNMALCASYDTGLTKEAAGIIGEELAALGFNLDFGPVLDVNNNPGNPIIGVRSFSDDPNLVAENGKKYIEGLHEKGVMTCIKHFPGHGDTQTDSHSGFPRIDKDYASLKSCELIPFAECIKAGADFIMTAHIQYPLIEKGIYNSISGGKEVYIPASLSETFLTDIIRKDMGFQGLIITDDLEMDAIDENFASIDVARMAINSGADLLLSPVVIDSNAGIKKFDSYLDKLVEMTDGGEIDIEKVNLAVERILRLKKEKGLSFEEDDISFEVTQSDVDRVNSTVGSLQHHEKEWEIALRCVTVVKNQGVLPIASGSKVMIACPGKALTRSAVYAEKLLRRDGVITDDTKITVINSSGMDSSSLIGAAGNVDVVVALSNVGKTSELSQLQSINLLCEEAAKAGKKSAVISCRLPYDLGRCSAEALIACYNGKGMTEEPTDFTKDTKQYEPNILAAIYTIFGGNNPTGKLPVRVPEIGEDYTFSSGTMYERGFGIEY